MRSSHHGGDIYSFEESHGTKSLDVLDFSSNVNALGMPDSVRRGWEDALSRVPVLPDPQCRKLRAEVARHLPLWPDNVAVNSSSSELLRFLIQIINPRKALLTEPCSTEYRRLLNLHGTEILSVLLEEADGFRFSFPKIMNAMRGMDLLVLGNPGNPAGTAMEKSDIRKLLEEARRLNVFVVLDESYADWCPDISLASETCDSSYFAILRSMNRFYAIPGLRVAYCLGARKLIEKVRLRQNYWPLNGPAEFLAVEAMRDSEYRESSIEWLRKEKGLFSKCLGGIEGLRVYEGLANFLLVRLMGRLEVQGLLDHLATAGMLGRGCGDFAGLGSSFLRVTVRLRDQNEGFAAAVKAWVEPRFKEQKVSLKP